AEAGQGVILAFVHAGHFGGFTAHQCATGQFAAAADAFHHARSNVHVEFAGGVIVEEEQGFSTAHHQIVDAHGHQIDADVVVVVVFHGQTQLGADTVRAGDQHRVAVFRRNAAHGAETAKASHDLRATGALGHR